MEYVEIQPGDHIYYEEGTHEHHGIYCGDISYKYRNYKNVVIHYTSKLKTGQIRGISYDKFAKNQEIYIAVYKEGSYYYPEMVVARAMSKLGELDYNLFWNNCEHFSHWCKTGKKISSQVNNPIGFFAATGGGALAGAAAGALLPLATPGIAVAGIAMAAGEVGGRIGKWVTESCMGKPDYEL